MVAENIRNSALGAESRRLFSLIQKRGPLTKPELAQIADYQLSSLNRYLEPLLAEGFIEPRGTAESGGGRPATLFGVRENRCFLIGVNIATVYLEVIVVNLGMNILSQERFDLTRGALPPQVMEMTRASIDRQLAGLSVGREDIIGIGLSSIGPFDRRQGVILRPIVLHWDPCWIGYPIREELARACGFPVVADIGANNTALAEFLFGHGRGVNNLLSVRCGMSIKTSFISSGIIVRTNNNAEDAFGHMSVDIDGLPCVCGNYGCIECYSSIPALESRFRADLKKGRTSSVGKAVDDVTYLDILSAARSGDGLAVEAVMQAATVLGTGMANYINLINPDVITLDGLIIRNSDLYYNTAVDVAKRKSGLLSGNAAFNFIRNSHFDDPATVGAAVLALETFLLKGDNLNGIAQ